MDICFIPNLGRKRSSDEPKWGADFFAEAFQNHVPYNVTIDYGLDNINDYDLVWVHNVANLLKGFKGRINTFSKLIRYHPPLIGGVRGEIGLKTARMYLKYFEAIHTSNNKLTSEVKQFHDRAYTLSSGVDQSWYAPHPHPEEFSVGWAGDSSKNMKNTELLQGLGVPVKWATKENYIPNHEMPERFYQKINTIVHPSSHEGSCRVITEAAACGLPIICTDVGHNSTIVDPEWMITLGDDTYDQILERLQLLKSNPSLAQKIGRQNQLQAIKYSWKNVIERATLIINEVMQVESKPELAKIPSNNLILAEAD